MFKKLNINDGAVGANVSCTLSKFFSPHLKTNYLWLITFLIISTYWNTSTEQKLRWTTLEFSLNYRTVRTVSTGLPILVCEDIKVSTLSLGSELATGMRSDTDLVFFSPLFYEIRLLLLIKLSREREKSFTYYSSKYWYMFYTYSYMHLL